MKNERQVNKEEFDAFLLDNAGRLEKIVNRISDPPSIAYRQDGVTVAVHWIYSGWGRPDEYFLESDNPTNGKPQG